MNSVVEVQYHFSKYESFHTLEISDRDEFDGKIEAYTPNIAPDIQNLPFKVVGIFCFDFPEYDEKLVGMMTFKNAPEGPVAPLFGKNSGSGRFHF